MAQEIQLNTHNKQEHPPKHIAEFDSSSIMIYVTEDNQISLDVKLENETVWLSQSQMALLFGRDRSVISRHINNIFKEGELEKSLVCANFAHTEKYGRKEGFVQVVTTEYYNLDVIISVGYRVKSINGTRFRQWANRVLKDYLIKGYAINDKIKLEHYNDLKNVVRLLSTTVKAQEKLSSDEYDGLFSVISDYVYALDTLDRYDFQQLLIENTIKEERFHATYENAMDAINRLKPKFGGSALFANEKDDSFRSSIGQIVSNMGWRGVISKY